MDIMRFHWLRDRECQKQFRTYIGDLVSWTMQITGLLHHPGKHHCNIRKSSERQLQF
jgi:hypothetical protein